MYASPPAMKPHKKSIRDFFSSAPRTPQSSQDSQTALPQASMYTLPRPRAIISSSPQMQQTLPSPPPSRAPSTLPQTPPRAGA